MTVQCISCRHLSMQKAGPMAKHGCGKCEYLPSPGTYVSARYWRECDRFKPAGGADVDKSRAYLEEQK